MELLTHAAIQEISHHAEREGETVLIISIVNIVALIVLAVMVAYMDKPIPKITFYCVWIQGLANALHQILKYWK